MNEAELRPLLDDPAAAEPWLRSLGLSDPATAHGVFVRLAELGVTIDLLITLGNQLAEHLPRSSDADLAIVSLGRFFEGARSPLALAAFFERDRDALPTLLQIFATSRHLGDLLISDGEQLQGACPSALEVERTEIAPFKSSSAA